VSPWEQGACARAQEQTAGRRLSTHCPATLRHVHSASPQDHSRRAEGTQLLVCSSPCCESQGTCRSQGLSYRNRTAYVGCIRRLVLPVDHPGARPPAWARPPAGRQATHPGHAADGSFCTQGQLPGRCALHNLAKQARAPAQKTGSFSRGLHFELLEAGAHVDPNVHVSPTVWHALHELIHLTAAQGCAFPISQSCLASVRLQACAGHKLITNPGKLPA
jgi:hypothetical protein